LTHYPIFLNLHDRPVLVVGAGKVALRKTRGLLEAGAQVTVVAPRSELEFKMLPVRMVRRRFRSSDLNGAVLVFAATDDREVNRKIGVAARRRNIFANIADSAEECHFLVPARLERGPVQIAIATGGRDPRRSAELRHKLEAALPPDPTLKKEHGVWVYQGEATNKSVAGAVARSRKKRIKDIVSP
jgi:siroheme synthase-like protein